jgi:hypothetical protein
MAAAASRPERVVGSNAEPTPAATPGLARNRGMLVVDAGRSRRVATLIAERMFAWIDQRDRARISVMR